MTATLHALRSEVIRLHIEELELRHFVGPNLRRIHLIALGALELRRLQAEHTVRRLRRKSELLHTASLAPAPDLAAIEQQLDLEFAAWRQRIRTLESEVDAANHTLENLMTDAADAEFKTLFRNLVARLHPELDAKRSPDPLWLSINAAFARHDFAGLRALEIVAAGIPAPEIPSDPAVLHDEETRLAACVKTRMEKIAKLRETQPLSLEPFLSDNVWLEHRRQEIEAETTTLETQSATLAARLAQILPAFSRAHPFGRN